MHQFYSPALANLLKLNILELGEISAGAEWNFDNISSPFNRLYLVSGGDAFVLSGSEKTELRPGFAYLIPCNKAYSYHCISSITKFYAHFKLEVGTGIDLFGSNLNYRKSPCGILTAPLKQSPHNLSELLSMSRQYREANLKASLTINSLFYELLSELIETSLDLDLPQARKLAVDYAFLFDYISQNVVHGMRLKDIGDALNCDYKILSRSFRKKTGVSLKRFILQTLNAKSQDLLIATQLPVYAIAQHLQFKDEFYFSRNFKKLNGFSPTEYRELFAQLK